MMPGKGLGWTIVKKGTGVFIYQGRDGFVRARRGHTL